MTVRVGYVVLISCIFVVDKSLAKPTQVEIVKVGSVQDPAYPSVAVDAAQDAESEDTVRNQRSPQFGIQDDYDDYSDYSNDSEARHFKHGHKHKPHHKPHHGGHGCRKHHGCGGGWQPHYPVIHHGGHQGGHETGHGSFATASAGSLGLGDHHGGQSQSHAQSASFNVGPYTASFSSAHASSGGPGGFGGLDY